VLTLAYVVWYIGLLIEVALIIRLVCWRVKLPLFAAYLCYDLPRWFALVVVDKWWPATNYYSTVWKWTEPVSLTLLWLMCMETFRLKRGKTCPGRLFWNMAMVGVVLIGILPGSLGSIRNYLLVRSLVAGTSMLMLAVLSVYRGEPHVIILTSFYAVDLISSLSTYLGAQNPRAAEFLIFGQTGCLFAWWYYVPQITRLYGMFPSTKERSSLELQ
jgi:hypothetical protein